MRNFSVAAGYLNSDKTVSFKYLEYFTDFQCLADYFLYEYQHALNVRKLLEDGYDMYGSQLFMDESNRYELDTNVHLTDCNICNNKYHYVNHVKKWTNTTLIFLFQKGKWYVNDTTFMKYDKWYSLETYLKKAYYDYHNQKLSSFFKFNYTIFKVISRKTTYYFGSTEELYSFLKNEEVKSINFEKLVKNGLDSSVNFYRIRNTHNREIKIKVVSPKYIIDSLKKVDELKEAGKI